MSERIGRVEGGAFVDERGDTDFGHVKSGLDGGGHADPEAVIRERMAEHDRVATERRVDEAIESLEHVIASIGPEALTWEQVSRLTDVNEKLLELYKAGLVALLKGKT